MKVEVKKFVKIGRPGYKGRQALAFYMVVTVWFIILVSLKNALLKKINVFFFFFLKLFTVTKQRDPEMGQQSLLFQVCIF